MITVRIDQTGDTAEAATPEAAVYAAVVLTDEAVEHRRSLGFRPTVTFWAPDGRVLAAQVPQRELWAAHGANLKAARP